MEYMKIGELSKILKVSIDTIRYYESIGVIPKPKRLDNGYRVYEEAYVDTIKFVRNANSNGFTLEEIKSILSSLNHDDFLDEKMQKVVNNKIIDIDSKIEELLNIKSFLKELLDNYKNVKQECNLLKP